jgi:glyoxylase-like metal-dependent hydrolase (beta-lactamase superfamily II)/rhodanese-related sulfurtransferase
MKIEQLYTNCLAQGAYYIEHNGEAAVIDPLREVEQYIELAESHGAKIKFVFETHFHADFVSGHVTLSEKTGAPIVFGPMADPSFDCIVAEDNQEFKIGGLTIRVLHTPGHTMESTTYLLLDENKKDVALFSGDTLFLGDVGRPDLAQKAASMTQEDLAGLLYNSLRTKIMTLPDDVVVYPGHGAGSACGKSMSKETIGLLGEQKQTNYALRRDMTKEEFVKELTDGLLPPPAYFPDNVRMNKIGYTDIDNVLEKGKKELSPTEVQQLLADADTIVLDVRHQSDFIAGHIKNSIFIGLDGTFAPWVGAVLKNVRQPIILVVDENRLEEAITRLARVGFDHILGYVKGGVDAWKNAGLPTDTLESIAASELEQQLLAEKSAVVDVRKVTEYQSEHIVDAVNRPLDDIAESAHTFPKDHFYLHCAGGYRSVIAASILKRNGIHHFTDVAGGFAAIRDTAIPKTAYICPTTL